MPNKHSMFRLITICACLLFVTLFYQAASAGVLDPTFGTGGKFTTTFSISGNPEPTFGQDIYVQPNGRIVAFGVHSGPGAIAPIKSITLMGLLPDGTLDPSFGTGGKIILHDPSGAVERLYTDSEMLAGGKFLLLSSFFIAPNSHSPSLVRLNNDGSPDTAFSADITVAPSGSNKALKMTVSPDGKIYVMVAATDLYLLRLNSDGTRDTSFGTNGAKMLTGRFRSSGDVIDLRTTQDGKIVIAYANGTVMKFDTNGILDPSFGTLGVAKLYTSYIFNFRLTQMLVQPDDKVLLFGSVGGQENTALFRFTRRGKLDSGFGLNGAVISDFTFNEDDYAQNGILLNDGRIVICGTSTPPLQSRLNFLTARYAPDGTLEASTVTSFFTGVHAWSSGLTLQPDGKIVVLGNTFSENIITTGVVRYNSIREGESTVRRTYDFNGDGLTDFSVYRQHPKSTAQSFWDVSTTFNNSLNTFFGVNGDIPVPSDFNDDGKTDVAVFRPGLGQWFYMTDINAPDYETVFFGQKGDIPFANDYDGDAKADFAVFRPSAATWYIRSISNGSVSTVQFGSPTDKPLTGDFDGDAKADLAVWRSSDATFRVLKSSDGLVLTKQLGTSGDIPVPNDFDGDGRTDFAVFAPAGDWSYQKSSTGQLVQFHWGMSGDLPVPGDYDGDGRADITVFRPGTTEWFVVKSNDGSTFGRVFGQSMDTPLPGR